MTRKRPHVVTSIAAIILSSLMAAPAHSGQVELDLLASYIGKWSGAGVLVGGKGSGILPLPADGSQG